MLKIKLSYKIRNLISVLYFLVQLKIRALGRAIRFCFPSSNQNQQSSCCRQADSETIYTKIYKNHSQHKSPGGEGLLNYGPWPIRDTVVITVIRIRPIYLNAFRKGF